MFMCACACSFEGMYKDNHRYAGEDIHEYIDILYACVCVCGTPLAFAESPGWRRRERERLERERREREREMYVDGNMLSPLSVCFW